VRLADHGIAAHAAQFFRDLAGGGAAFPHAGQFVDAFVGPAHPYCPKSRPNVGVKQASCQPARYPIVGQSWPINPRRNPDRRNRQRCGLFVPAAVSRSGTADPWQLQPPGLWTLYMKEVRRFFKVRPRRSGHRRSQRCFSGDTVAMGRGGRMVLGVNFASFVAPGLIMMGMMNNAFQNASFSFLAGKIQGRSSIS
jgi:hypothetical protein